MRLFHVHRYNESVLVNEWVHEQKKCPEGKLRYPVSQKYSCVYIYNIVLILK